MARSAGAAYLHLFSQLNYEPENLVERPARIELALSAWEAEILPLNEERVESGAGDENRTRMRLASDSLEGCCPANGPLPQYVA